MDLETWRYCIYKDFNYIEIFLKIQQIPKFWLGSDLDFEWRALVHFTTRCASAKMDTPIGVPFLG